MTIGIGVLASQKQKPDTIILLADTKGTFSEKQSMNRLHKIFKDEEINLYAVAADRIDRASELFGFISKMLRETFHKDGRRGYTSVLDAVHAAADLFKRARFRYDVLPQHAQPPLSIPEMFTEKDLTPQLLKRWRKFYFGCQMIVGAILANGQACMFYIGGDGEVDNFTFPGFVAIGSGGDDAMFWLGYRNQHLGRSLKQSAYHAFEAKTMAESAAYVNDKAEMLIADSSGSFELNDFKPTPKNAKFTLADLRKLLVRFGPRKTDKL